MSTVISTVMFTKAEPVWAKELQGALNAGLVAAARFEVPVGGPPHATLRLAAMSHYRAWCNGRFVAVGPARAAHSHARVDELDLSPFLVAGTNELRLEVVAFHSWNYSHVADPGFVQAEVEVAGRVVSHTSAGDTGFTLATWGGRHTRVSRYSFQRAFSESYGLPAAGTPLTAVARAARKLLARSAPIPTFAVSEAVRLLATGDAKPRTPVPAVRPFFWEKLKDDVYRQYPRAQWEADPITELERLEHTITAPGPHAERFGGRVSLSRFALYEMERNLSGMWHARVRTDKGCRLVLTFDELLDKGAVNPRRMDCVNCVAWDIPAGEHTVESFEPFTGKYVQVQCLSGECELLSVGIRRYENPDAARAEFECADAELNEIFEAGRATYAQNAVDFFTDCPSRERAGWLGDSFFTGRAARALTGTSEVERAFLENFLHAPPDGRLPEGMVPMCYPGDHPNGVFLPQWGLWLLLELEEYLARSGDRSLIDAFEPKVAALLGWFARFERPDGVLTGLPGWSFIEWSKANDFQKDLNYPTSMLYGGALKAAGRLYARADWITHGDRILRAVTAECFDGTFFVDNAMLKGDRYVPTRNRTEVCQYYALYFGAASRESHPKLWETLVADFGPDRVARGLHPEIHPANMIWGIMLRLELLRAAGLGAKVIDDLRGYLLPMARSTGTLWEHNNTSASCNHGFASHACHLLFEEALGVAITGKTVRLKEPPPTLAWCRGAIPVDGGFVRVSWKREGGAVVREHTLPAGYQLA